MKSLSYGVREFQARIGEALRAVGRGEQVVITSRGRAVAVLARAQAGIPGESAEDRRVRRLAAEGRLRLGRPGPVPAYRVPRARGLAAQLEADRR